MTYKRRKNLERVLMKKAGDVLIFIKNLLMAVFKCFIVTCAGYYIVSEMLNGKFLFPCILFLDFVFVIYTKAYDIFDELDEDEDGE